MQKYILNTIQGSLFLLFTLFVSSADAACTVWHTECYYECLEWYPNGTDCRKSRKICYRVCDDFDVVPSAPTAKGSSPQSAVPGGIPEQVQLSGRLGWLLALPKDHPRWNLRLDKALRISGQEIKNIEVAFAKPQEVITAQNKVKISGTIAWRPARTKGVYPVLEASSIETSIK